MKADYTVQTTPNKFSDGFPVVETKSTTINNKPATILYRPENAFIKSETASRADEIKNVMVDEDIFYSSYEDGYEPDNSFFSPDEPQTLSTHQEQQNNDDLYQSLVEEQNSTSSIFFVIPLIIILCVGAAIGLTHFKARKEQEDIDKARERLNERLKHIDYIEKIQKEERNPFLY